MMTMAELSAHVRARDRICRWPYCSYPVTTINPLECAHLNHRGMGGSKNANRPDNAVLLCKHHHDILDGRTTQGRRLEIAILLAAYISREQTT